MTYLADKTDEELAEIRAKAKASKDAKREWAKVNLKLDWGDESHWRELASTYSYRLPNRYDKASAKYVNRFLKHFNLDKEWYSDVTGFSNGNKEASANPTMPAFAQVGFLLEQYNEDQTSIS